MVVLRTKMTAAAKRSFIGKKSLEGISSPGGEETGEGERKTHFIFLFEFIDSAHGPNRTRSRFAQ